MLIYDEDDIVEGNGFAYVIAEDRENVTLSGSTEEYIQENAYILAFINGMMYFDPGLSTTPADAMYVFEELNCSAFPLAAGP